jgi:hypothetical protein
LVQSAPPRHDPPPAHFSFAKIDACIASNRFLRLAVTFASFFPFFRLYEFQGFKRTRIETAKALQGVEGDVLKDDILSEQDLLCRFPFSFRQTVSSDKAAVEPSHHYYCHLRKTLYYEGLFGGQDKQLLGAPAWLRPSKSIPTGKDLTIEQSISIIIQLMVRRSAH